MRSLTLRIYLTVLAALALFALASGALVQRHLTQEREALQQAAQERAAAWAELLQRSLPGADAPRDEQAEALAEWSARLRLPLALDDPAGERIGASDSYRRRETEFGPPGRRGQAIRLVDGRTLWIMRPVMVRGPGGGPGAGPGAGPAGAMHGPGMGPMSGPMSGPGPGPGRAPEAVGWPLVLVPWQVLPGGLGLAALLLVLFVAVALGAWPVARRLTRRLQALKQGVEAFGEGALHHRVAEEGRDEVSAVAASFNRAAARIEALVGAHRSLLANASHELRSPLARLKMALGMLDDAAPSQRERLQREIGANIAELDALVDEVLLSSRLDAQAAPLAREPVELLAVAAEEAARFGVAAGGEPVELLGDERLLRRALRNLLENARRYGGQGVEVEVRRRDAPGSKGAELSVCDRGPGVPEAYRERVFEAFFRMPGHAEREGGVGLGLALVRQIAERHGGRVRCAPRDGGGSCFVIELPGG